MMYLACILVIGLCASMVLRSLPHFEHRMSECVFFATFGLIFGLAPMMQSDEAYVHVFGEGARAAAAGYSLAGLLMLMAGFALADWPLKRLATRKRRLLEELARPETQRMLMLVFWVSIGITVAGHALVMHAKGVTLLDIIRGGRFEYRFNNRGFLSVLGLHLTTFCFVPPFVGLFLGKRHRIVTLLYIPAACMVYFFIFSKGTRSVPLAMVATFLVAASIRYRFPVRRIVATCAIGLFVMMMAVGLYELRRVQDTVTFTEGVGVLFSAAAYQDMWDRDPLSYSMHLVGAVAAFPAEHPFLNGATYRRMAVFYLQESRFPELKPPDTNILFGLVVHGRDEDLEVTVPPSILGDVYINFWGWWGLPALCLHGMLYRWMFRTMQTTLFGLLWLGPLSGRFLVLVHRGEPYEMFFLYSMFFLLMGSVFVVCRSLAGSRRRSLVRKRVPARWRPTGIAANAVT
ncbi:hypothetical protein Pla175_07520 [Pirellulimonas nuda]|uniref:Oligosaccharide repeat unit polymerase n=1 Tax=Pirellulimonas nuda TaxID=2528009 RepID=A0A518D7D3_9BACT|nr:O-antigen polymerase [Pirellulimonas nuda]QDU87392.1 hypothetical protein Pla175_07520 [Pirellulimonas nuda]